MTTLVDVDAELLAEVRARYSEPQRHYHTFAHIERLLSLLQTHRELLSNAHAAVYAVLFHDIVYDPTKGDNEERSVDVFDAFAERTKLDEGTAALVRTMIRCTIKHQLPDTSAALPTVDFNDVKLFLDCDLEVLSWPPAEYDVYAQQIRQEYIHVPETLFRQKRPEVLRRFLDRSQLYFTDRFNTLHEQNARMNLKREVAQLEQATLCS